MTTRSVNTSSPLMQRPLNWPLGVIRSCPKTENKVQPPVNVGFDRACAYGPSLCPNSNRGKKDFSGYQRDACKRRLSIALVQLWQPENNRSGRAIFPAVAEFYKAHRLRTVWRPEDCGAVVSNLVHDRVIV